MATQIPLGRTVNGYTIVEYLASGNAISYIATSPKEVSPANRDGKVFFKQYKSPSVRVPWYKGYVAYQQEIKRRIDSTDLKNFACRIIDFFEAKFGQVAFFEVFEYVEKGHGLKVKLERARKHAGAVPWAQRLIWARAMMAAIKKLHDAKIVHADLKPDNIMLIEDPSIDAKYRVKLIDMDSSVLADRRAPWHGVNPYVGSDGYRSPEHLPREGIPIPASDVFTCGLILYELLAGVNPYEIGDIDAYSRAVLGYRATPPKLLGPTPFGNDDDVVSIIHQSLNPDARKRPSAYDVLLVLNGRKPEAVRPPVVESAAKTELLKSMPPSLGSGAATAAPAAGGQLRLESPAGHLQFGVRTTVGQRIVRSLGDDAKFWHEDQMVVEPRGGEWFVLPNPSAQNETMLNGRAVVAPTQLRDGDVLGVGRESKNLVKLPFTVHIA